MSGGASEFEVGACGAVACHSSPLGPMMYRVRELSPATSRTSCWELLLWLISA